MAFRTGTKQGPAKTLDYLGIAGGLLAPLTILVFVVAGALWLDVHYESPREASELIDATLDGGGSVDTADVRKAIATIETEERYASEASGMVVSSRLDQRDRLRELNDRVLNDASYSHLHDMMSGLGDRDDGLGPWFLVVNWAVGVFLVLFALAVFRRVAVGRWVVLLLLVAAFLSATLGTARCQDSCNLQADPNRYDQIPHQFAAIGLLILIVIIPALAALDLPRVDDDTTDPLERSYRKLIVLARWLPQVAFVTGVLTIGLRLTVDRYAGLFQRLTWGIGYLFIIATALMMWRHRRGFGGKRFDIRSVQENVLYGSAARRHAAFVLVSIKDRDVFARKLRGALESKLIRSEVPRPRPAASPRRDFTITVAFTHAGLEKMEIPYEWKSRSVDPFAIGMAGRKEVLGDGDWQDPWLNDLHALFWITAESKHQLDRQLRLLETRFDGATGPFETIHAAALDDGKEVFGYRDGLSNPWIKDVHDEKNAADRARRQGGGKLGPDGKWEQIALGEFILGEVDESRDVFPVPEPTRVFEGGTFMVLRQLEQHRKTLDSWTEEEDHHRPKGSGIDVAAKMMGRHHSGVALAESRDGPSGWQNNDFTYGLDPEGFECPIGAHVRRANPRDSLGFEGVPAHRRRIIRRGMPYRDQNKRDDKDGLMFVAFNARIADQFEFIQQNWLNDGDAFRAGASPDPIAGAWKNATHFTINRQGGPVRIKLEKPPVKPLGGEYLLVPSMRGLAAIADQ